MYDYEVNNYYATVQCDLLAGEEHCESEGKRVAAASCVVALMSQLFLMFHVAAE